MGKQEERLGINETFRDKLSKLIADDTQEKFAAKVDMEVDTLKSYFRKEAKSPSVGTAIQIAKACNVSLDWLFNMGGEKELQPARITPQALLVNFYQIIKMLRLSLKFQDEKAILYTEDKDIVRFLEDIQACKSIEEVRKVLKRYDHLTIYNGELLSKEEANRKHEAELRRSFIYEGILNGKQYEDLMPLTAEDLEVFPEECHEEKERRKAIWEKVKKEVEHE